MRTRDVPCPIPQERPIEPALLAPPPLSEAMRVVTAARGSGSEAWRKPSARLTRSMTQRAAGPCKKPSSQPSIVAISSPFLHTTSLFRPAMRIRLRRKLGSQTLHFQVVWKKFSGSPQRRASDNVRATLEDSPFEGEHRRTAQSEGSTMGMRWQEEERSCLTRQTLWMEAGCTSRTTAAMEFRSSCMEG